MCFFLSHSLIIFISNYFNFYLFIFPYLCMYVRDTLSMSMMIHKHDTTPHTHTQGSDSGFDEEADGGEHACMHVIYLIVHTLILFKINFYLT